MVTIIYTSKKRFRKTITKRYKSKEAAKRAIQAMSKRYKYSYYRPFKF